MATFTLTINCDNAAFDDSPTGCELARILRSLADNVNDCDMQDLMVLATGRLRDSNGNPVGNWHFDGEG